MKIAESHASDVRGKVYENAGNSRLLRLVPTDALLVLDVGCGAGDNAKALSTQAKVVDGITLSSSEQVRAAQWCKQCWVYDLESGLPPGLNGRYNAVICSHVLEHLRWPSRMLSCLKPLLEPGSGCLLIALPNLLFYKNRIQLLFGRFEYQDSGIMDASHFRWFTFVTARRLVEQAGYRVLVHEVEGSAPLPLIRRYLPRRVSGALDRFAEWILPGLFGWQILIVATPKE